MKELSIEEKAKAYDEVRDKIALRFGANVAKEIFSQFEESKDERIRKYMIKYFEANKDELSKGFRWNGITVEECIAWLEKQIEKGTNGNEREIPNSEQKPADKVEPNLLTLERAKKMSPFMRSGFENEPTAWSKEDEEMFYAVIADIRFTQKAHNHEVNQIVYEREIDWFKSLKDRYTWKPSDEQMNLLREVQQALLGKDCHNRFVNFMYELKRLREE